MAPLASIDVGCGAKKRPGFVGVDQMSLPGVDHVVDLTQHPLPLADRSVGQIFSSHCLEHLPDPLPVWRELSRVAADGALCELWAPYSWHGDAHLHGHVSTHNERQYLHMGAWNRAHWRGYLGAFWRVRELVFVIQADTVRDLRRNGVHPSFALRYLHGVALELGVFAEIRHGAEDDGADDAPVVCWATDRRPSQRRVVPGAAEAALLRARGLRASALVAR